MSLQLMDSCRREPEAIIWTEDLVARMSREQQEKAYCIACKWLDRDTSSPLFSMKTSDRLWAFVTHMHDRKFQR